MLLLSEALLWGLRLPRWFFLQALQQAASHQAHGEHSSLATAPSPFLLWGQATGQGSGGVRTVVNHTVGVL